MELNCVQASQVKEKAKTFADGYLDRILFNSF